MLIRRFTATVKEVTERKTVVRSTVVDRGLPTQRVESETTSAGWFVYCDGNFSIGFGGEKPELKSGDELTITIEGVVYHE